MFVSGNVDTVFTMAMRCTQLQCHIYNQTDNSSPTWNTGHEDTNSVINLWLYFIRAGLLSVLEIV